MRKKSNFLLGKKTQILVCWQILHVRHSLMNHDLPQLACHLTWRVHCDTILYPSPVRICWVFTAEKFHFIKKFYQNKESTKERSWGNNYYPWNEVKNSGIRVDLLDPYFRAQLQREPGQRMVLLSVPGYASKSAHSDVIRWLIDWLGTRICLKVWALPCYPMVDWLIGYEDMPQSLGTPFLLQSLCTLKIDTFRKQTDQTRPTPAYLWA